MDTSYNANLPQADGGGSDPHATLLAERKKEWLRMVQQEVILSRESVVMAYEVELDMLKTIAPQVKDVVALGASEEELKEWVVSCRRQGIHNVCGFRLDIHSRSQMALPLSGDLFLICMTLHHQSEPFALLCAAQRCLKLGGSLAILDLEPDEGEYHADPSDVYHQGFDLSLLCEQVRASGFTSVRAIALPPVRKEARSGGMRDFGLFLLIAEKN